MASASSRWQLNGRTMGDQALRPYAGGVRATGPGIVARAAPFPARGHADDGELFLVPEKGIRLRATKREGVSQVDARTAGESKAGTLPSGSSRKTGAFISASKPSSPG